MSLQSTYIFISVFFWLLNSSYVYLEWSFIFIYDSVPDRFTVGLDAVSDKEHLERLVEWLDPDTTRALEEIEGDVFVEMNKKDIRQLKRAQKKRQKSKKKEQIKAATSRSERKAARQKYRAEKREIRNARDELIQTFGPMRWLDPTVQLWEEYTLEVNSPENKRDAKVLSRSLLNEAEDTLAVLHETLQSAVSQDIITSTQKEIDELTLAITQARVNGDSTLLDAYRKKNKSVEYTSNKWSSQKWCEPISGSWLLATDTFDGMSNLQKKRMTKVATIWTALLTAYGLYRAIFKKDKWRQSALWLMWWLWLAAYIHGGTFKFPSQLVKETLNGWYTYDALTKMFGLESDEVSQNPVSGMELESLWVAQVGSIIQWMSYRQLHQGGYVDIVDGRVVIAWDEESCPLAKYREDKWESKKAKRIWSLYKQQKEWVYGLDEWLIILWEKQRVIKWADTSRTIDVWSKRFSYREKKLDTYMKKHKLVIADAAWRELIKDYLAHRAWVTFKDIISDSSILISWSESPIQRQLNVPQDQYDALKELKSLQKVFWSMSVAKFRELIVVQPWSTLVSINRDIVKDLYPSLAWRFTSDTQKDSIDYSMTVFFGEVLAFSDAWWVELLLWWYGGDAMDVFFTEYKSILENYAYMWEYLNEISYTLTWEQEKLVLDYLQKDYATSVERRDALLEIIENPEVVTYNVAWNELLRNVTIQSPSVQRSLISLESLQWTWTNNEKNTLSMWTWWYNAMLGDKMPTPWLLQVSPSNTDEISWKAYNKNVTIRKIWDNRYSVIPEWWYSIEVARPEEAMQLAHLFTFWYWIFKYSANTQSPWERRGDTIKFNHDNSWWDRAENVYNSSWSLSQMYDSLRKVFATTAFSEEWIKKLYPVLLKTWVWEKAIRTMNTMWNREMESSKNVEEVDNKLMQVQRYVLDYNATHPNNEVEIEEVNWRIKQTWTEITLQLVNDPKNTIRVNLISNDIFANWWIGANDIETSVMYAIWILRLKKWLPEVWDWTKKKPWQAREWIKSFF